MLVSAMEGVAQHNAEMLFRVLSLTTALLFFEVARHRRKKRRVDAHVGYGLRVRHV
jgi:hypothetical protein